MTRPDPGLDNQASWRSLLRVAGPLLLGAGVLLTAIAMVDFFSALNSFEAPRNFWLGFIGLPLIAVGSAMTKAAYLGPASRYVAGEVTPVLRDTMGALGIGGTELVCASCGGRNAADAKFCDDCGVAMHRTCSACTATNAADAKFCDDCGAALATP